MACAVAVVIAAAGAMPTAASATAGDLTLISRAAGADGAAGTGPSEGAAVTPDGRYVAFESLGGILTPGANNGVKHVYVRDTVASTTTLVTRATGVAGPVGDGWSARPSISADGRYVAYESLADNLSAEDDDESSDVFVRDLLLETTTLASRGSGVAGAQNKGHSTRPSLSADGSRVAYGSVQRADPPGAGPVEAKYVGEDGVFVRDLAKGTTIAVEPDPPEGSLAAGVTFNAFAGTEAMASLSADGRHVAYVISYFLAFAPDPNVPDDEGGESWERQAVFERDLVGGRTILVNRATASRPSLESADGDFSRAPSISADGRYVAFESDGNRLTFDDPDYKTDVFVHDAVRDTTTLVSRADGNDGALGDGESAAPSISADGRYVGFTSHADNLSPDDDDAHANVFLRDRFAGTTTLVSRGPGAGGAPARGASSRVAVSATGRYVAFQSDADGLAPGAGDHSADVFLRDLGVPAPAREPAPAPGVAPTAPTPVDTVAPQITELSLSRRAFAAARSERTAATRFRFTLSEPARLDVLLERRRPGLRYPLGSEARCERAGRNLRRALVADLRRKGLRGSALERAIAARRCVGYEHAGNVEWPGAGPGRVQQAFSGRSGRRALAIGRYRATLTATDLAANASQPQRIAFKVVRRR